MSKKIFKGKNISGTVKSPLNKSKFKSILAKIFIYVLLVDIAFVILFPLISKLSASLMSNSDLYDRTVILIPKNPTFENYSVVFEESFFLEAAKNTTLISLMCAVIQTLICAMTGYGLAKCKSKLANIVLLCVVLTILIPQQIILVPMFLKFRFFDIAGIIELFTGKTITLMNSVWPMIILSITGLGFKNGLYIFIMRQFYKGIPEEIEEAAWIDGYGIMPTYFKVVLPMSVPMMITIFMFSFSWQWTDTFYSGMFFSEMKVLANTIFSMTSTFHSGNFAGNYSTSSLLQTGVLMAILPLVIVYIFAQKKIIGGIERSGLVG
ncbi:MAG: carbohydrate ABC transporter permease [Clostridia bacterium]|nr:carbohydrate ABC transporter permease [Clostridia bacterium]